MCYACIKEKNQHERSQSYDEDLRRQCRDDQNERHRAGSDASVYDGAFRKPVEPVHDRTGGKRGPGGGKSHRRSVHWRTAREITFTSGGSEADNQAIRSAALLGAKKGKKHIISTKFEHHAVLHTLAKLEKEGFEVTLLDVHENGLVTAQQVKDAIREDTCLVTIMFANNEIGTIQPIAEIGAVCHAAGVLFHTDAVQAAGHVAIDVNAMHIDMLSMSGHKFHGPKGVGALYARRGIILTNIIEGGAQERGKRAGTENVPGIVGMAAALKDACDHLDENAKKVSALRDRLIAGLRKIPHCALNGAESPRPARQCELLLRGHRRREPAAASRCEGHQQPRPARHARPGLWTPAMCCWQSADPMRWRTGFAAADALRRKYDGRSRIYAGRNSAGRDVSSQYVSCVERTRTRRKAVHAVSWM